MYLRRFNESGIEQFRQNLNLMKQGKMQFLMPNLVNNDEYAPILEQEIRMPYEPNFDNKLELAQNLHPCIDVLELENKFYDTGLWAWLAAYYFDLICPLEENVRPVRQMLRYIPEDKVSLNYHRHLIFLPVKTYDLHGEMPKIMYFASPLYEYGEVLESLASRQDIWTNSGILQAANLLYFDEKKKTYKSGITGRNRAGNIRRFISVIQQFDLTYDLYSLDGDEIIELLPKHEFGQWLTS